MGLPFQNGNTTMKLELSLDQVKRMIRVENRTMRWLWMILLVGLLLRLLYAVDQPTKILYRHGGGGDSGWYLANGAGFFSGQEHGYIRGIAYYVSSLPTPPFYIIFTGFFQTFLPKHETVVAIRLVQILISLGTAYLAFRVCRVISGDSRAGIISAALLALHPAFIVEASTIATETLYVFFILMALWLYIEYVVEPAGGRHPFRISARAALILAAMAFGMATLTRAVFVLFPLGIVAHMMLLGYRTRTRGWIGKSFLLLLVYAAMLSTWTIYNLALWDRFVIVSDQLMPAVWRAVVPDDGSPQENDALLLQDAANTVPDDCEVDCKFQHATDTYVKQIADSVGGQPGEFVARRLNELTNALLQPHGTTSLGSTSIKEAVEAWWQNDRSLGGLLAVTRIEGFLLKSAIWILHLLGIVLGLTGMWLTRRAWQHTLPLVGFVIYTVLIHLVLPAIPRYLFPIEVIWLIFAVVAVNALYWRRLSESKGGVA